MADQVPNRYARLGKGFLDYISILCEVSVVVIQYIFYANVFHFPPCFLLSSLPFLKSIKNLVIIIIASALKDPKVEASPNKHTLLQYISAS